MSNEPNVTKVRVKYTSKEEDKYKKFEIQKTWKDRSAIIPLKDLPVENSEQEGTYQFDLPFNHEEGDYYYSLKSGLYKFAPKCRITMPSKNGYNYELIPGNEKVKVESSDDAPKEKIEYIIPPDDQKWELILKGSINTGGDDPVEVKEDDDGNLADKYLLRKLGRVIGNVGILEDFLSEMWEVENPESPNDSTIKKNLKMRELIIGQALELFEQVYVHLPLKKAMHVAGPIQRIRLLKLHALELGKNRMPTISEKIFRKRMLFIFNELRDLHTQFLLPSPYKDKIAFLPFLIEEFYDKPKKRGKKIIRKRKYMVSKVFKGFEKTIEGPFKEGVIITHWNGIPIETAIALNGERNAGGNKYARHARGLEQMTIRPLIRSLPPNENWVDITFENRDEKSGDETSGHAKFIWYVAGDTPQQNGAIESTEDDIQAALGIDISTEMVHRTKKALFFEENAGPEPLHTKTIEEEKRAENLYTFKIKQTTAENLGLEPWEEKSNLTFGYFRIYSFNVDDPEYFVNEFNMKILPALKTVDGLIIDVRGNGGGLITAGENLLQAFYSKDDEKNSLKNKPIVPERFQFINSPLMLNLCGNDRNGGLGLKRWADSIERSIETGAVYSQGFPLLNNCEGFTVNHNQRYEGPVILLTDALCYSTTDIFAAGFKDNNIGKILGVHKKTGAGGANVWGLRLLHQLIHGEQLTLPHPDFIGCDWNFRVAVRRALRVGDKVGMPLEDLGVEPDHIHYMTENDITSQNKDLIDEAAWILLGKPQSRRFQDEETEVVEPGIAVPGVENSANGVGVEIDDYQEHEGYPDL